MQRRKFLIGMGSLAAGGAAATGTGAFTQVTAERDVTVKTAGDAGAYLDLNPISEYSEISGGQLTLNFGELNTESDFRFYDVFQVKNTTDQPIAIFLDTGAGYGWSDQQEKNLKGTLYDNLASNGVNQNGWFDDSTNEDPESIPNINGPECAPSAYNQSISDSYTRTWSVSNDHIIGTGQAIEPDWYVFDTPESTSFSVSGTMRIIAYTRDFVEAEKSLAEL